MKVIFGTDAIKYPLTGIGRYAYELAKGLSDSSEISELLFLNGRTISTSLPVLRQQSSGAAGLRNRIKKNRLAAELYRVTSPWLKTSALSHHKNAIYHGPNFYLPPKVNRCVATFHDLSVFTMPHCHPVERVRYMQKELLHTLKRAKILITDSDFTRNELIEYFNLSPQKIFTAKLACSNDFYPREVNELSQKLAKFQLKINGYCLFTSSIEPRKNIDTLLDAYECLPLKARKNIPLVVCGFKGWNSDNVHLRLEKGQREGWINYLGYTASEDLPFLFAGARSFLFPSLYEGFGLPVLEALASGTPVVCSDSSSLPEVAGDAGLMCDAMDVDTLTSNIIRSIEDEEWREQAKSLGLRRAKQFSWQRCAQETILAYKQVE